MSLFHNANFFGSRIIHILYTGCAKIKKNNSGAKGLRVKVYGKGKGHPRADHEGAEGVQRCSSAISLTSALDWGGWSSPRPGRFISGKDLVPTV